MPLCKLLIGALLLGAVPAFSAGPAAAVRVVDRLDLPCEPGALKTIAAPVVSLAIGEYEPLVVEVTGSVARAPEVSGLRRGVTVAKRVVTPYKRKLRADREATQLYLLEEPAPDVSATSAVYWLTFNAQDGAKPGRYEITLKAGDASTKVRMVVRPFRLRRNGPFYGAFCGSRDTDITPRHMRDLHERGFDALQFFWGSVSMPIQNDAGRMKIDFSIVDKWMTDFRQAGMRGPVVWSMGNDSTSHLENRLSQVFDIPRPAPFDREGKRVNFSDIRNPELNRRLKELMLAIKAHAAEQKWPEIVFIIYDEPTERLMVEHEDRYKFIKSFWPELKIYGVTMDRIEWAKAINHMVDILVANGDFKEIGDLAESSGKPFWLYGSGSSRDEASLRHSYAWKPWAFNAKSVWFWAYNYHAGNPYDDFDSRGADSTMSMVWPPRTPQGPIAYSVSWEGMREAADDMAYVQTLEWMLAKSQTTRAGEIRAKLNDMKAAVPSGARVTVLGGDPHDRIDTVDARTFVKESREAVASWIEELLLADKREYRDVRVR
jgi:hypothetical protein